MNQLRKIQVQEPLTPEEILWGQLEEKVSEMIVMIAVKKRAVNRTKLTNRLMEITQEHIEEYHG